MQKKNKKNENLHQGALLHAIKKNDLRIFV